VSRSLLAELQRRNVLRVAATYAVVAWLLIQISATVLPMFGAPAWIARAVVVVLVLAFVPLLVLSWAFELTPQGLKTQAEADAAGLPSRLGGSRVNVAIGILLVLALGLFAMGRYSATPDTVASDAVTRVASVDDAKKEPVTPEDASIGVLPFVNMSADKDNEYFSDGLSETLLNMLAQVPDLKVAGRTSSFAFKGKNEDLRKIGGALGVANVLEGSVQRVGETVRITAQLIAVSDGTHRWSKSYDRKLDDVFKIQDEIATEVVGALRVAMLPQARARLTLKRTDNVAAYEEYLQGVALMPRRKVSEMREAAKHFERAIEMDPGFARAYVGAADSYLLLEQYGRHDAELVARAKRHVERALEIAPDLGDAHATLAFFLASTENRERVEPEFKRAIELAPSYATAFLWYGAHLRSKPGRSAESLSMLQRAASLEPLSPIVQSNLGTSQHNAGLIAESRATMDSLATRFPDFPAGHLYAAIHARHRGDLVGALRALRDYEAADPESFQFRVLDCIGLYQFGAGARAEECVARFALAAPHERRVKEAQAWSALVSGDAAQAATLMHPRMAPELQILILLNLGRAPDAMAIARERFSDLLITPAPQVRANQREDALLIGSLLLQAGQKQAGRALLHRVLEASPRGVSIDELESPWVDATAHSLLGSRDEAIADLARTIAQGRFTHLHQLDGDLILSGLRNHPRYEATVAPARAKAAEQVRLAEAAGLF